jgi:hypothetical protein
MIDVNRDYCLPLARNHMQFSSIRSLVGMPSHASIASMKWCEQSHRDDLKSFGYS